jgi:hypothetical protein
MAESDDKPPEQKLTPNQQAIEDLSWDIIFFRTIWNFFVREGEVVKNDWLAIFVIVGIAVWITHSVTKSGIDDTVSNLKGQLTEAKADRDKNQLMLAPFEAMAIAKNTNAPLNQRLDLLVNAMTAVTNAIASDKPVLHLEINGFKFTSYESPKVGDVMPSTSLLLNTNRQIALFVVNDSTVTAEHITVDFVADIDSSNILADQWVLEPKVLGGRNHWHSVATDTQGAMGGWTPQTIVISQTFKNRFLNGQFLIHADRSTTWD